MVVLRFTQQALLSAWAAPAVFLLTYLFIYIYVFLCRNPERLSQLSKNPKLRKTDRSRSKDPRVFNICVWSHVTNFKGYLLLKKEKPFRKKWPKFKEKIALSFCGICIKPQEFCRQDEVSFLQLREHGKPESYILRKIPQKPDLWSWNSLLPVTSLPWSLLLVWSFPLEQK